MDCHRIVLVLFVILLLQACSSSRLTNVAEIEARRHMAIADTLERAAELGKATFEYATVAERFPTTSVYAAAVRKTALLYSSPLNPAANDSISRYWLNSYLGITTSAEEKQIIQMYLKMVDRVAWLRDSLARKSTTGDSLATLARRQAGELSSRSKRITELEAELEKASGELKKLKEIDLRLSKSRGKNKP